MKKAILFLLMTLLSPLTHADFKESRDYVRLFPSQPVSTGQRIEVREFFWYSCPHCFHLEPVLNEWLKHKPADVEFVRTPAVLRQSWEPQARAYYAFEALGVAKRLHDPFFDAIHVRHRDLSDEEQMAAWAARHGVSAQAFRSAYHSFAVDTRIRNAKALEQAEGINAVPTLVVEGRYLTNVGMAGGRKRMMRLLDFLVQKAKKTHAAD